MGDEAVGFESTIGLTRSNAPSTVFFDLIRVRVGRAVVGFNFSKAYERIPEGPAIVRTVLGRVSKAEASK